MILLITNIPTPYRIPLFNELKIQLANVGLQLKVVFGATGYDRRKWKVDMAECLFDYEVLPSKKIYRENPERTAFTYPDLFALISRENPRLIITSGFSVATTKLLLKSWFKKTPYIIWSGAVQGRDETDSLLRRIQRTMLVKRASGFVAYGTKAKEYLISLGAARDKIEIGINTVDTEFFRTESARLRKSAQKHAENKHLLYIGHLTRGKRIDRLFNAINILSQERKDFVLELVGDGAEAGNLRRLAKNLGVEELVRFEGFKQKKDIPPYLAHADCFIFPSEYDVWGLVLVEAMAAGVPCIASIHAGATSDLIKDGITGFALDFSETEKVVEKVSWILDNPGFAGKIGDSASRFISENVSIAKSAEGFVRSITTVLK